MLCFVPDTDIQSSTMKIHKKDYIFKTVTNLGKNNYTKMHMKYIYFMLSILQISLCIIKYPAIVFLLY